MFWSSKWWLGCCSRTAIYKLITLCNCVFIFLFFLSFFFFFFHTEMTTVCYTVCARCQTDVKLNRIHKFYGNKNGRKLTHSNLTAGIIWLATLCRLHLRHAMRMRKIELKIKIDLIARRYGKHKGNSLHLESHSENISSDARWFVAKHSFCDWFNVHAFRPDEKRPKGIWLQLTAVKTCVNVIIRCSNALKEITTNWVSVKPQTQFSILTRRKYSAENVFDTISTCNWIFVSQNKMSVVIETTAGDLTVDLFLEERPRACLNFLKLCKLKYYNYNLFHTIERGFIAQTGGKW